ncbi:MAG: hypothetical protein QW220_07140 [Candidatus Bathyarchaeia archaeon]
MVLAILGGAVVSSYAYFGFGRWSNQSWTILWNPKATNSGIQTVGTKALANNSNICGRGLKLGFRMLSLEVSEEFEERILSIVNEDPDVKELLQEGYNITGIRPTIKAIVQANGDITMKATGAIVSMRGERGWAQIQVDLEAGKVIRIVILSKKVIEKTP